MALSPAARDAATRSALGHLGADPSLSTREVVEAIKERMGIGGVHDTPGLYAAVRAARALLAEGASVQGDAADLDPHTVRARDPTLSDSLAQYRYRVVIQIDDPQTEESYSTVVIVDSSTPLTSREVLDEARAAFLGDPTRNGYYDDRSATSADAIVREQIITAGRR